MAGAHTNFIEILQHKAREALLEVICEQPGTTVAELSGLAREFSALQAITLGDLVSASENVQGTPERVTASTPVPRSATSVNTRTPAGRAEYDAAVIAALEDLGGGPVLSADLIKKAGGTTTQARAALTRLINAGRVTWTGKARGTRYSLAR